MVQIHKISFFFFLCLFFLTSAEAEIPRAAQDGAPYLSSIPLKIAAESVAASASDTTSGSDVNPAKDTSLTDFTAPVQISPLPPIPLDHVGTHKTLPPSLWAGSDPGTLIHLFKQVGAYPLTPAEIKTITHMLLAQTQGVRPDKSVFSSDNRLLIERLKALMALGRFSDVLDLINVVPAQRQNYDEILKIKALAMLFSGQTQSACALMETSDKLADLASKMRLSCLIANGDKTGAELAYAVLKESGSLDDFSKALGDRLFQETSTPYPDHFTFEPWHVYLLAALKDQMPDLSNAPLWVKRALSIQPTAPLSSRILWIEQTGADPDELDKLYRSVPPHISPKTGALIRAVNYQKMQQETNMDQKGHALKAFIHSARDDQLFKALAPVIEPVLNTIKPDPAYKDLVFDAVQIYALTDNLSMAEPWYQLLKNKTDLTDETQGALLSILMNKLGAGMPQNLESFLSYCSQNMTDACRQFMVQAPSYFAVNPDQITPLKILTYPPVMAGSLENYLNQDRVGETVLRLILAQNELKYLSLHNQKLSKNSRGAPKKTSLSSGKNQMDKNTPSQNGRKGHPSISAQADESVFETADTLNNMDPLLMTVWEKIRPLTLSKPIIIESYIYE